MVIKYKFNEYTVAFGQEYIIDSPLFSDINVHFTLQNFNDIFKINKYNGSIIISSNVDIGIYELIIFTQTEQTILKIIIKPNISYMITSFYNNNNYNTYLPILNPPNLTGEYYFEENYEYIKINNNTGEISFDENIVAGIYNLVIKCTIENIEQLCITTFNIYPIVKYDKVEYYCDKLEIFLTDTPYVKPFNGIFKLNNDYTGITINNITGQITVNKPISGYYKLIIIYTVNNVSININISLYVKPTIIYDKSIIEYNVLSQLIAPTNTDYGGIYSLEYNNTNNLEYNNTNNLEYNNTNNLEYNKDSIIKKIAINQSDGRIIIKNAIPTGNYLIKVLYTYNNYTTETIAEISITPNIFYLNNKIEITYGTKYQTDIPQSNEIIDGLFSLIKIYDDIHINPNNGIIYFNNNLSCNDYCIDINYNKNNINKIIQFYIKIKPHLKITNLEKQEINYYENLHDLLLETNPPTGSIITNLNIPIDNELIHLSKLEKKIGNYELKIKYSVNKIQNTLTYYFCILPYIIYNTNNININYKQTYISEEPSVYPYDGIFILETNNSYINIDEKTGKINISSGLSVGIYNLVIKYKSNKMINKTNFKITIKPTFISKKNTFIHKHDILATNETINLEPLDVYPKGGIFSIDKFIIDKNGIITIPTKIDVGDYIFNVKYSYLDIDNFFDYTLYVIPYKLSCVFKQCEKIYDGTPYVNIKYIVNNDIKLTLLYDSEFENKNAGINKKIEIKNIKIVENKNIIHDDTTILGIIKTRKLNITFIGIDKYYDGHTNAQVNFTIDNNIEGDDIYIESYNCVYEIPYVGINKIIITNIILGGTDSKNYFIDSKYETSGKINPKEIFVIFKSPTMIYSGSTNVNLEIEKIEDVCNNEKIIIESYIANFELDSVGENIPIIVKNIKVFKNNNYILTAKPLFGTIIKKEILLNAIPNTKIYDGTTIATVTFNTNINIISYEANYENKNVGNKKKIFVNNIKTTNTNYILKDLILFGSITPLPLIVNFVGADKFYDGLVTIKGDYEIINKIETDKIEINSIITFKNSNASNNKELLYTIPKLSGQDSNNYKINILKLNSPHIFKKKIEIEFIGINKIYDNTTNAIVKMIVNDKNIKIKSYNAYFENKDVGENKKIIIDNIILINENYYCENTFTYANIEKKQITMLIEPIPKEYDGTTDAEIKIINILGICFNDNMYITSYKATFQDPNVGTNKLITITNIEYGGISNNNYYCKDFTAKSNIIKKKIIFEISNNEKYYDGTTNINLELKTKNNINISSFIANFDNPNIGIDKNIYVKHINLISNDILKNYSFSDFMCKGTILPKYINLNFIAKNKIYDSTNNAIVTLSDNYKLNYEAFYEDCNVGNNKKIIVKILDGLIPNYILYETYITYGNILPIEIKLIPIINDKIYDNKTHHIVTFDISNNEVISYNADFEDSNVGINKKLNITQIKLKNTNYYCKDFSIIGTILPLCIDMIYIIKPKIYDNTTKAIIENSQGITYYDANYISSNVGTHDVHIKNVILTNKNYIVNNSIIQAVILQKTISINIIINEKQYDGTTTAIIKSFNSKYNVNIIDYDAQFENSLIGDNKKVTVKNIKLDNQNYNCNDIILISKITKKNININFKEINKIYDGTSNANLEILNLTDIIQNEIVFIKSFESYYLNKYCGNTMLNLYNVILDGTHSNNYIIENQRIPTKIIKRKLKYIINVTDKKYDGNNYAFINIVLDNIINYEDIYIENFIALYNDEKIGENKEITIRDIILGGKDKNNYEIDKSIILFGNII